MSDACDENLSPPEQSIEQAPVRIDVNAPNYGAAYLAANQDPTLAASTTGSAALPVDFLRPYQGFGNICASNYRSTWFPQH